jgi:hypothetical protein
MPVQASDTVVDETSGLYDRDFFLWTQAQAAHLRARQAAALDWDALAEEIEDMGKRDRQAVESNLIVVLMHLLKWQHQPHARSGSWRGSIREYRRRVRVLLRDSPSLRRHAGEALAELHCDAVKQAADETGLARDAFPADCPYALQQVLDEDFLPQ